jgi:hypothetical protein
MRPFSLVSVLLFVSFVSACDDTSKPAEVDKDTSEPDTVEVLEEDTREVDTSVPAEDTAATIDTSPAPDSTESDANEAPSCPEGEHGCACIDGRRCGTARDGAALLCEDARCEHPECRAGEIGCACRDGYACEGDQSACWDGFCRPVDCAPGDEHCDCRAGSCKPGLLCIAGAICRDATGYEGGACFPNGSCRPGARCESSVDVCVHCEAGTAGCSCTEAGSCGANLACMAGRCTEAWSLPPRNPRCYSPCRQDLIGLTDDVRVCGADGLLEGCVGDKTCTDGSCLAEGESPKSCESDIDCPYFQTCLEGGCYSNCDSNAECPAGRGCYKRVCRIPCQSDREECPTGYTCESGDGQNGFCVALLSNSPGPSSVPNAGFSLSTQALRFTNIAVSREVLVTGDPARSQTLKIRKLRHTLRHADGRVDEVDARFDGATGDLLPCDASAGECPLDWIEISAGGAATREPELEVELNAGCRPNGPGSCPKLVIGRAGSSPGVSWDGVIEVSSRDAHVRIYMSYVEQPAGQWSGSMYYFGSFNDARVDEWMAKTIDADTVPNGLIAQWDAFEENRLDSSWAEFVAILTATRTESWRFQNVRERCAEIGSEACYPFTNEFGVRSYVQDLDSAPIPTGVVEFPIAFNLKMQGTSPKDLTGRIVSDRALHYPGNPEVSLSLESDPSVPGACNPRIPGNCVIFMTDFDATIDVGARYDSPASNCGVGFGAYDIPWLIPGFISGTTLDASSGARYKRSCRDSELPYDATVQGNPALADDNENLSLANPVPDGLSRRRRLEFLAGALVNQRQMFILFRERFGSFIPGQQDTAAYGYMLLERAPANLTEDDFVGGKPPATLTKVESRRGEATCSADLLLEATGASDPAELSAGELDGLVDTLIGGSPTGGGSAFVAADISKVHYYCEDTRAFDAGKDGNTECPPGSLVLYFYSPTLTASEVQNHACQSDGSCRATLNRWLAQGRAFEPLHRCADEDAVACSDDRLDLREGKAFFIPSGGSAVPFFMPIKPLIESAFRFKTRFQSESGATIGFTPDICIPNSDERPYCYSPEQITEVRDRIDCLIELYSDQSLFTALSAPTAGRLNTFLRQSFSRFPDHDGFERLYAELLIMLGDDALVRAFASRFDLAATSSAVFEGSRFEPSGIDLSGVAGAQMRNLHQAVQYYETALGRAYMLGPDFSAALSRGAITSDANFISQETVTLYFGRLVRAGTQKALAWSEISKQYQSLNRPDLARRVIERAFAGTYLESALMTHVMQAIVARSGASVRDQIRLELERAQQSLRASLRDMSSVHQAIFDDLSYFGFPADYMPFPAVDDGNARVVNAYDVMRGIVDQKMEVARRREFAALDAMVQLGVDRASFQAELIRVKNTYENELAQLCGTMTGRDGETYPATRKYAHLNDLASVAGDPCGLMGTGRIHEARLRLKDQALALEGILLRHSNLEKEIELEKERVTEVCKWNDGAAAFKYKTLGEIIDINEGIARRRATMGLIQGGLEAIMSALQVSSCGDPISCANAGGLAVAAFSSGTAISLLNYTRELETLKVQKTIAQKEQAIAQWEGDLPCELAKVDSNKTTAVLDLQLDEITLEGLRGEYQLQLALSEVSEQINAARRWEAQQAEAEQIQINIEAARNDPNVRLYRNDAVINADIAFNDALRAVYRLTRVFEFYTSQSYARREDLFLVRMITAGSENLENYIAELENALFDFEEQFGVPSTRVQVLSLRDDIFQIPYYDEYGGALSQGARIELMRERLSDVTLLDSKGYLAIPFSTRIEELSPLTRNHKIDYIETDIVGSNIGDTVGRLYLRARGTGIIAGVDGERDYYVFPQRTAVINPFFNGNRIYDAEVYRNYTLKDRPLVNTNWELVINRRDEVVNRDIDLGSLSDIRILMFYKDFTAY